jgi:hypothetical protein
MGESELNATTLSITEKTRIGGRVRVEGRIFTVES